MNKNTPLTKEQAMEKLDKVYDLLRKEFPENDGNKVAITLITSVEDETDEDAFAQREFMMGKHGDLCAQLCALAEANPLFIPEIFQACANLSASIAISAEEEMTVQVHIPFSKGAEA